MAKRRLSEALEPAAKLARAHHRHGPGDGVPDGEPGFEAEYFVEQRWVGFVLGRAGSASRDVEQEYGVKIVLDQATKADGYSKLHITGAATAVQAAAEHINSSISKACRTSGGSGEVGPFLLSVPPISGLITGQTDVEELDVEQPMVGWLLGRGGAAVKEMEEKTGCSITINQETKKLGYSKVQVRGDTAQRAHAMSIICESLDRGRALGEGGGGAVGSRAPASSPPMDLRVDQKWVGLLLGRGGEQLREIEQASGCSIVINQETKHQGYSTIHIEGPDVGIDAAQQHIRAILNKVGGELSEGRQVGSLSHQGGRGGGHSQRGHLSVVAGQSEFQLEQKWVGWILGKSGTVLREIEAATGAQVMIDQSTKDHGYSMVKVNGSQSQVEQVWDSLVQKLDHVGGVSGLQPVPANGRGHSMQSKSGQQAGTSNALGGSSPNKVVAALQVLSGLSASDQEKVIAALGALSAVKESLGGRDQKPSSLRVPPTPPQDPKGTFEDVFEVEQKWVGWLLGKGGAVSREMESQSGAQIIIDQSTKDQGFSRVRIVGGTVACQTARELVLAKLEQARGPSSGA